MEAAKQKAQEQRELTAIGLTSSILFNIFAGYKYATTDSVPKLPISSREVDDALLVADAARGTTDQELINQAIQIVEQNLSAKTVEEFAERLGLNWENYSALHHTKFQYVIPKDTAIELGLLPENGLTAGTYEDTGHGVQFILGGVRDGDTFNANPLITTHEFCHGVSKLLRAYRYTYNGQQVDGRQYLIAMLIDYYQEHGEDTDLGRVLSYIFDGENPKAGTYGHGDFTQFGSLDEIKANVLTHGDIFVRSESGNATINMPEEIWASVVSMAAASVDYDELPAEFQELFSVCVLPEGFKEDNYRDPLQRDVYKYGTFVSTLMTLVMIMVILKNYWQGKKR